MTHFFHTICCAVYDERRPSGVQVVDQRKQAVSIRLGGSDLRNIKRLAQRLGVRDSDIIRYAVKTVLRGLSPLCDATMKGRNLVPVLVESGDELIRYFELDTYRLDSIINAQAEGATRVDRDDIALLAMSGMREQYLVMRMKDGNTTTQEEAPSGRSLRNYLYEKYIYRNEDTHPAENPARPPEAEIRPAPEAEVRLAQRSVA